MRAARPDRLDDDEHLDASVLVTRDYFWMLRIGVLGSHTRFGWRAFENGYTAMGMDQPPYNSDMAESPLPTGASRIESILEAPR